MRSTIWRTRGDALGKAMTSLAEAERLLTVAREAPERRQNAAALRGQAAIVESLGDLGPLASELRDLMLSVSFTDCRLHAGRWRT